MIIKKFVARTEEDAVEAAKKELGPNAVIMNVRVVKRKGLAALFFPKRVEVTAALEENGGAQQAYRDASQRDAVPRSSLTPSDAGGLSQEDKLSIEKRLDSLQTLLVSRFQQEEVQRQEAASGEDLPFADEKEEKPEEKQQVTEQDKFVRLLYNTMLESEVDEKYANQIVNEVDVAGKSNLPFDYILESIYQKMILKFGRAEGITPAAGAPRIVLFMGPTGVGKTTTIAKIASSFSVEDRKKVAFLTADTYRIAAVEQLRTYANILEVPFRVIYTEEEAREAIREFNEYDYIFVDTAGHSHRNAEQLEHMKKLREAVCEEGECQAFLVLSSTTKYHDLLKIISSYEGVADYQLIFTKLDETATMGNLLNVKLYADTPIAYVTYGQNVPNDFEQFDPQKTVKQILSVGCGMN